MRGNDSVHLAIALTWEDTLREKVELVTFDQQLSEAAQEVGLNVSPHTLTSSYLNPNYAVQEGEKNKIGGNLR